MEGYFLYIAQKFEHVRFGEPPDLKFPFVKELKTWAFWRAVLAEFIGTMLFVFISCGSAINLTHATLSTDPDTAMEVRISFTFGLTIATLIQMFGHVSGGHFNPAVSISMCVILKISPFRAILYTIAQCCGGMLGALLLKGVTPSAFHNNLGVNSVNADLTAAQGFGVETILTFFLVFSILGTTDENRPLFGSPAVGIGFTVAVAHLMSIPYTGTGINPARTLGPAVVSGSYDDFWIYWIGPILGGVTAALLYKWVFDPYRCAVPKDKAVVEILNDSEMIPIPKDYFKADKNTVGTTHV